jgi:AcrR family transcriptional regulator
MAAALGVSRATIYRWFGSREGLLGEVLATEAETVIARARRDSKGDGIDVLLETFDRANRTFADAPALHSLLRGEREGALRVLTSSAGRVQTRTVAAITALIDDETSAGNYVPPIPSETLAYAIVRLAEAFLYNDAIVGMRGDTERLLELEALLLGAAPPSPRT